MQTSYERLPIFTYGSLQNGGIESVIGRSAVRPMMMVEAKGITVGFGDKYPCADITNDQNDKIKGINYYLDSNLYVDYLKVLDNYEGTDEGYYERKKIITCHINNDCIVIPAWIYVRGFKL